MSWTKCVLWFFFLMKQRQPGSTRTNILFPYRRSSDLLVQHGHADRHGQRIAAIGRPMGAEHHALGRFLGREAGTQREARADALGHRHDEIGRAPSALQSLMRISYAVF